MRHSLMCWEVCLKVCICFKMLLGISTQEQWMIADADFLVSAVCHFSKDHQKYDHQTKRICSCRNNLTFIA